jgi:proteasome accessory factor B
MSRRKTERLLSLVVCLLSSQQYLTASQIQAAVPGYPDSSHAFKRMFEKDIEELRELGIPLERDPNSSLDEARGYRIPQQAYALPEIRLEPDEAATLLLAARAWRQGELADAAASALRKLVAAGVEFEGTPQHIIESWLAADKPAFSPLWKAVRDRRPVTFRYRAAGRSSPNQCHLEPWGVVSRNGRWYVVGRDQDRDAVRVFSLSRIEGQVAFCGPRGAVRVPDGVKVRELVAAWDSPPVNRRTAVLKVRAGKGVGLRHSATHEQPEGDGWDRVEVPYADTAWFADHVASFGADVIVTEPPDLREAVITRLKGLLISVGFDNKRHKTSLADAEPPSGYGPAGPLSDAGNAWSEKRNSPARDPDPVARVSVDSDRSPADPGAAGTSSPAPPYLPADNDESALGEKLRSRQRYLMGQCQESVPVGKPFSLLASIVLASRPVSAELEPFDVPAGGRDVLLVLYAPGLQLLSDQQQAVHVPADADSKPVRFELRADTPGPLRLSITAWIGGNYLGELSIEITAERDRPPGPHREIITEITTESIEGAVSLVVRYDPKQNAYRFEFRDDDNPDEVTSNLAYDPAPLVEKLVAELDDLAKGRSGYSAAQARNHLVNAGAGLWNQLIPEALREQFWDRQDRIRHLTILADRDIVPWELLYPIDPGHDAGFLVQQFPVTRAIFGWRPTRVLHLWPARFVLPEGSLPEARDEIVAVQRLLDPRQPPSEVISALTPLTDLIGGGNFGLLHFACHNTYYPADGSSIKLGNVQFTPTLLTVPVIQKVLTRSAPTVFINACRSAGLAATYNRLDGWASKFLGAGAAAFIGSLWAVSDGAAREFAQEFYRQLQAGSSLGGAAMQAREVAACQPDDPTWLAYTVYGDPRARVSQRP